MNQSVCVIGLGYIGLPTASLLATKGFQVHGVDTNGQIVEKLIRGEVLIQEPALDIMVKSAVHSGKLTTSQTSEPSDIFIIAVPTPFKNGHAPDLKYVFQAVESLSPVLKPGNLVVLESTSPVGATEEIAKLLEKYRPDLSVSQRCNEEDCSSQPVYVAHCPERVLPGQILKELVDNDRIVGGIDPVSATKAESFYKKFVSGKILVTDSRTAEMAKLVENAYRDVNIAFANELSLICEEMDINVWELINLANHHPRVNILQPGPGVGGHCIAVDPWFIIFNQPEKTPLMQAARQVNDAKPEFVARKIQTKAERFKHPVIACLGLSYKADVDDLRESPAIRIVRILCSQNEAEVLVVEPYISTLPPEIDNARLLSLDEALEKADIIAVLVGHRPFGSINPAVLKDKIVLDFVNALP